MTRAEKKYIRPPDEHSFEIAVGLAARALRNDLHISNSVSIQMDEGTNAPRLYPRYEALKRENADLKATLGAICFCDDRKHLAVQAADMLGNVVLKTWRKLLNSDGPVISAFQQLTAIQSASATKPVHMLHFDLERLRRLAELRREQEDRMAMPVDAQ